MMGDIATLKREVDCRTVVERERISEAIAQFPDEGWQHTARRIAEKAQECFLIYSLFTLAKTN